MPVQQGRHGYFEIAGVKYPCYDIRYQAPRNLVAALPVSNTWVTAHGLGARTSRVVARMLLREKSTELLAATFWNLLMQRTWSAGFDDTTAFAMNVATGRRLRALTNCKFESANVVVAFGAPVALNCVFLCPGVATKSDQLAADYLNTFDNSPPLMFDKATFGGITGPVHQFEFTYSNNHLPNGPLNGTKFLTSWDAGVRSAAVKLLVPEHVAASEPFADEGQISLSLVGGVTRVFTFTSVVPNDPDDIALQPGQLFQEYNGLVKGNAAGDIPMVVT